MDSCQIEKKVLEKPFIKPESFIKVKDNWIRCPECGKKFFKGEIVSIEIKCKGCKKIFKMADYNNM